MQRLALNYMLENKRQRIPKGQYKINVREYRRGQYKMDW